MKKWWTYMLFVCVVYSCKTPASQVKESRLKKADDLAREFIIVDGHVDLPYRLQISNFRFEKKYIGIPIQSESGDFDYVRAKQGGLDAPFMSIYIPSSKDEAEAKALADTLIHMVSYIADNNAAFFEVATSPSDVERIKYSGRIALPMGMENGSPITRLEDAAYYRRRGISYVTLTHAKDNHICDSSYDTTATWNGLSPFGYELVPELAAQGIMIDVSHISDSAFFDVVSISPVPLMASHSSARIFTPGFERNMSDELIAKMGENNGVIMVNFGSTFLDGAVADRWEADTQLLDKELKERGLDEHSVLGKAYIEDFRKTHPLVFSDVEKVADHIDHIVKIAGIDHVGFGSDYDGVGDSLPTSLKDVSDYPNLIYVLLERGYSDEDIAKICYKNVFRVWQATLDYSAN